ncbi:UNVERIFIED_CONTAM: hypothetical protein FKN15_006809 [Acipenser sinensis]
MYSGTDKITTLPFLADILPLSEKEDDLTVAINIAPNMDAISVRKLINSLL